MSTWTWFMQVGYLFGTIIYFCEGGPDDIEGCVTFAILGLVLVLLGVWDKRVKSANETRRWTAEERQLYLKLRSVARGMFQDITLPPSLEEFERDRESIVREQQPFVDGWFETTASQYYLLWELDHRFARRESAIDPRSQRYAHDQLLKLEREYDDRRTTAKILGFNVPTLRSCAERYREAVLA